MDRFQLFRRLSIGLLIVGFLCHIATKFELPGGVRDIAEALTWALLVSGLCALGCAWWVRSSPGESYGETQRVSVDRESQLQEYQAYMNEAASAFLEAVQDKMCEQPWETAIGDIRWFPDGSNIFKTRIRVPDSQELVSVKTPTGMIWTLSDAWRMQPTLFADVWYGLLLMVYPDGRCETKFNYDPNCGNDPSFFIPQVKPPEGEGTDARQKEGRS